MKEFKAVERGGAVSVNKFSFEEKTVTVRTQTTSVAGKGKKFAWMGGPASSPAVTGGSGTVKRESVALNVLAAEKDRDY